MLQRNLDTFYWVATLKSFRKAAEKLFLTQPAISARIASLEENLNVALFDREGRSIQLTPHGRKLLVYAEKFIRLEEALLRDFGQQSGAGAALRVGVSETLATTWFPEFLARLSNERPAVSMEIHVDATSVLREQLVQREIDLACLMGPVSDSSICNLELCQFEMAFVAVPKLSALHKSWSCAALAAQPLLTFASNTRPHRELLELLSGPDLPALKMTSASSLSTLTKLVREGVGLGVLPLAAVAGEIESGSLCVLKTDLQLNAIGFTASYAMSPFSSVPADVAKAAQAFLKPKLIKKIYRK
ncbi:LysR family transcriptional regulator [Pelagibius sp. Alg239-R121]|uniref:LysR family transcriptional regulator n=1 Tax=Pelagibius sp. Alg239-R121 TaxID=2993448 RepID=UPI0024A648E8|nr:LysR family transcriptional regulator [Pelagibius sp. Alg239-R121]